MIQHLHTDSLLDCISGNRFLQFDAILTCFYVAYTKLLNTKISALCKARNKNIMRPMQNGVSTLKGNHTYA